MTVKSITVEEEYDGVTRSATILFPDGVKSTEAVRAAAYEQERQRKSAKVNRPAETEHRLWDEERGITLPLPNQNS